MKGLMNYSVKRNLNGTKELRLNIYWRVILIRNTTTNGRHRKTKIFQLEDGGNIVDGDAQLKQLSTNYYKKLFGPPDNSHIQLNEHHVQDIP